MQQNVHYLILIVSVESIISNLGEIVWDPLSKIQLLGKINEQL